MIGALAAAATAVTHPATWAADRRTDRDGHVRSNEILVTSKEAERDVSFLTSFDFDGGGGKIPGWN